MLVYQSWQLTSANKSSNFDAQTTKQHKQQK